MSHQTNRIMPYFTPCALLFTLLFFGIFSVNHHACNQTDHNSLLSLFLLSAPSLPLNWSSIDCCYWEGISCDHNGQVTHIWLPSKGLKGSIPPFLGNLTHLSHLNLSHNSLSGPLPNGFFSSLNQLMILDLSHNDLSGELPINIGNLSNLKNLLLHTNSLSGSFPPSLMNCTNLIQLNLWNNSLEGNISNLNFSNLQQLTILDLGFNGFTGSLPASLGSCKSLRAIRVSRNKLDGQIPPEVAQLKYLSFFSVTSNNLTNITGAINILMRCKILDILIFGENFYFETFPTEDNIAASGAFENLRMLTISRCQLNGQFPTWISKLKKLKVLNLNENRITGSIPGWLSSTLPRLFSLRLENNLISGEFSRELCLFPALASEQAPEDNDYFLLPIFVSENGTVFQHNTFSAWYPTISLRGNSLSGPIPIEIGGLKMLHLLYLDHNNFSGNIPDQISELTRVLQLDLSGNRLSGKIPESLTRLNFLSRFSVANNNLYGPIPTSTQLQSFDASAYEGNLGLCGSPLPKCGNTTTSGNGIQNDDEKDGHTISGFHISMILGFITGFWGVFGSLAFHHKWRMTYFQFMYNLKDRFMVTLAVCLARMHRRL